MLKRASIVLPAITGATIGWLAATLVFLAGYREELLTVFVALSLLYAVLAWEMRWWKDLRIRLPFSVFGGGILAGMLCPAVSRRLDYSQTDIIWLLNPRGPLDIVVFTIIGALLFVLVIATLSPMSNANAK